MMCDVVVDVNEELEEAVERICELAQGNSALREKNAVLVERVRLLEARAGEMEHFVVSKGHVEAFGTWRRQLGRVTVKNDLGGLAAREVGVDAAIKYLEKRGKA